MTYYYLKNSPTETIPES